MEQNSFTLIHPLIMDMDRIAILERELRTAGENVKGRRPAAGRLILRFDHAPTHFARFVILKPAAGSSRRDMPHSLLFNSDHDLDMAEYLRACLALPEFRGAMHEIYSHCDGYENWLDPASGTPADAGREKFIGYLRKGKLKVGAEHRAYWGATVDRIRLGEQAIRDGRAWLDQRLEGPGAEGLESVQLAEALRQELRKTYSPFSIPLTVNLLPRILVFIPTSLWRARKILLLVMAAYAAYRLFIHPGPQGCRVLVLHGLEAIGALIVSAVAGLWGLHLLAMALNRREHKAANDGNEKGEVKGLLSVSDLEAMEDRKFQNQMTHLSVIRADRAGFLKAVLKGIDLLAKGYFNKGVLGGITTIHFARWIILEDGTLLFQSNYDGSWESYLGDFVGKAFLGLSGVWSNTVKFPRCFFNLFGNFVDGGARHEQDFKRWTRVYQQETQYWYSAFPGLSVRNILDGLRCLEMLGKGKFTQSEAVTWLRLF